MRVSVQKWGNSLALRIPRSLASDSRIKQGSVVELSLVQGQIVVSLVNRPAESLETLLAGVTRKNLHRAVETGTAIGREVW